MARRDASKPQLDFPQLTADLIRALNLTGTLGLLDFSDLVSPVFLIGSRGIDFGGAAPAFGSAETFFGESPSPVANTVFADTGQLPAGTYDLMANLAIKGSQGPGVGTPLALEHRNAANAATLATLLSMPTSGTNLFSWGALPLAGYIIGLNERLRLISGSVNTTGQVSGTIFIRLRPTP